MFKPDDIEITNPYTFIYRARISVMEIEGYGFTEAQAIASLEREYNRYLDSFLCEEKSLLSPTLVESHI